MVNIAEHYGPESVILAKVADQLEADFDHFVSRVEAALLARIQGTQGSAALQHPIRNGVEAGVRDLLARLRVDAERPAALPPELARLAGVQGAAGCEVPELGYDLTQSHVAIVADAACALDGLADRTGRQLLQVLAPDGGVWAWLGGPTQLCDAEFDELLEWQRSHGGCVAFGEPAEGVTGFSASHAQALEAKSIANATGQHVVRYADVRLLSAVLRDGRLAKAFVERELGELDHQNERMSELRATLRVYLEQGQSVSTTAVLRQRDRKTIQRQLRSAERLLRHYVHDRSGELLIALQTGDILRHSRPSTQAHAG